MKTIGFFDFVDHPEIRGSETLDCTSLAVPDMSLSVKDILERCRRGTIDLNSLIRHDLDLNQDIDDDSLDGIEDIVDVELLSSRNNGKVAQILRDASLPPSNDVERTQGDEGNAE